MALSDEIRAPRILIACDKFKGSLTSTEVAAHLAAGIVSASPTARVEFVPIADGGDGSLDVAVAAGAALLQVNVVDAHGNAALPAIAQQRDLAVIEVARICGLGARRPSPEQSLRATSRGVGIAIRAALDNGARTIVLAVGGTATTDGGAGILAALGCRLLDAHGNAIPDGGAGLAQLDTLDTAGLDPRLADVELIVASDVDNPLLGASGSAAVYGPQKGAGLAEVQRLDLALARLAACAAAPTGFANPHAATTPGAGAGGGIGYAALLLGGTVRSGAEYFLELAGFAERLATADLVITGEGRLDSQSLHGKAPVVVAAQAAAKGVAARAVVGLNLLNPEQGRAAGFAAMDSLTDLDPRCATDPELSGRLLKEIGRRIGTTPIPPHFA